MSTAHALTTAEVPPQNLEAEEAVLGAMLLSENAIGAVTEIIGRVHPDFATLRREMIDTGLMAREREVYWRKE